MKTSKLTKSTVAFITLLAANAGAQTIQDISFSIPFGGEPVESAPTTTELDILVDGIISNGFTQNGSLPGTDFSIIVRPVNDATTNLGHEFLINFTTPSDITSFELFSDFRFLDAFITLADIEFFSGQNGTGTSVGGQTGLVFGSPTAPDPDPNVTNPNFIDPVSSVTQQVSATGAFSAILTIQEANELTSLGSGGYQLREISFNALLIPDAVPEPSSTALLAMGGLALLGRRKRA